MGFYVNGDDLSVIVQPVKLRIHSGVWEL